VKKGSARYYFRYPVGLPMERADKKNYNLELLLFDSAFAKCTEKAELLTPRRD